jgi:hypothetical protein
MHSGQAQHRGGSVNTLTKNFTHMQTLREDKVQPKERAVDVVALLKALHPEWRHATQHCPTTTRRGQKADYDNFKQEPIVVPPDGGG